MLKRLGDLQQRIYNGHRFVFLPITMKTHRQQHKNWLVVDMGRLDLVPAVPVDSRSTCMLDGASLLSASPLRSNHEVPSESVLIMAPTR